MNLKYCRGSRSRVVRKGQVPLRIISVGLDRIGTFKIQLATPVKEDVKIAWK